MSDKNRDDRIGSIQAQPLDVFSDLPPNNQHRQKTFPNDSSSSLRDVLATHFQVIFESLNKATSRTKAYGAPRVFDLFTMLAITLAFALLFSLLGLLAPAVFASASDLTLATSSFITLIGISQMWLFGSTNPRFASLITGPFAFALVVFFWLEMTYDWVWALMYSIFAAGLFGSFFGYLAGAC